MRETLCQAHKTPAGFVSVCDNSAYDNDRSLNRRGKIRHRQSTIIRGILCRLNHAFHPVAAHCTLGRFRRQIQIPLQKLRPYIETGFTERI